MFCEQNVLQIKKMTTNNCHFCSVQILVLNLETCYNTTIKCMFMLLDIYLFTLNYTRRRLVTSYEQHSMMSNTSASHEPCNRSQCFLATVAISSFSSESGDLHCELHTEYAN